MRPGSLLRRRTLAELQSTRLDVDGSTDDDVRRTAAEIVEEVRRGGETALRVLSERFGDRRPDQPLILDRKELEHHRDRLPRDQRALLERVAERIERFARAQRAALTDVEILVPGGRAGHRVLPVERAGGYVPGGRYPLPSSALMSAIPARVAGVSEIWLSGPRPSPATLAAAAIAGADGFLQVGGAQAIAALAYGAGAVPRCDVVVGPGNRWVAAAKRMVSGDVGIDSIAGPSEVVVVADSSSDPELVAADLLAQAEHDVVARPILITWDAAWIERVEAALWARLEDLPTADTARAALGCGGVLHCATPEAAIAACDALAPEHLQLSLPAAREFAPRFRCYGALFIGEGSAEVLGDYGAGPNHTLPTGGSARHASGLSVLHFLTVRTWLEIDDRGAAQGQLQDAATFARLEGLEGHARAAEARRGRR
jgi:phosphoribosyl-ATP pyrophosphohydrolase/phosphoribosyl-AMP cyclohydrolase/histidinol dehydrogenase